MPLDPNKTAIQIQCDKSLLLRIDEYCARTGARRPSAIVAILNEYFEGRRAANSQDLLLEGELKGVDVKSPHPIPGKPKHRSHTKP